MHGLVMDAEKINNFTVAQLCQPIAEIYCSFKQAFKLKLND